MNIVVVQLLSHFSVRRFEWFMALAFLLVGWRLADPADTFGNSASYQHMARWASEDTWAVILMWTGLLRCLVLFFNGVVMRRAAEIRAAFAVFSFSIVLMMAFGLETAAAAPSSAAVLYFLMAIFELSNIWTAALDSQARRAALRSRNAGSPR